MKSAQILKQKIQSQQLTLGLLVTNFLWFDLVEISRNAGLDYLIVDLEHNAYDEQLVSDVLALGRMIDFPMLIRVQDPETIFIRRAADKGACGIVLPTVESAKVLDAVRDGLYMPPRGVRRPGGPGNRWMTGTGYEYTKWVERVENDFIVIPQIENQKGLENADEIAKHEITTAIGIGPYDLSASLGVCWEPSNPKLIAAQEKIRKAGRDAGKNMWMVGDGESLKARGFTFLCIGEATSFFEASLGNHVNALRTKNPVAPVKNDRVY